ncbi:MAG TPA: hypothetical protein VIY86_01955, partial [Pirellulaceae bacterium]
YTIPALTPFRLTGSATDANGDALTYNWEQRSLGAAQALSAPDNGASPIFRSWTSNTSPTRYFPRLSNLVNNTLPLGEKYPAVARSMPFRLTVRDNRAGGGGVNTDDMVVTVVATGAAFAVTSPNVGSVVWTAGTMETVTWNVSGTSGGSVNTPNVNILLSTDGGFTYPTSLATNVPNDGSHPITVPSVDTTTARIMVEGAGNVFFDISNANFRIIAMDNTAPTAVGSAPTITAAGGTSHTISVTYTDNAALNASTIGPGDIEIVAPNLAVIPATYVSRSSDSNLASIIGMYSIAAPGGTWDPADNGTYTVRVLASQVLDTSGNSVSAGNVGTFQVSTPEPGSDCSNPAPEGLLADGISDLIYNPATGIMSYRVDSTNFPNDGLVEIQIESPFPVGFPPGAAQWSSTNYVGGMTTFAFPVTSGTPGHQVDLPLVQYAAGLGAVDFGCTSYVTAGLPQRT